MSFLFKKKSWTEWNSQLAIYIIVVKLNVVNREISLVFNCLDNSCALHKTTGSNNVQCDIASAYIIIKHVSLFSASSWSLLIFNGNRQLLHENTVKRKTESDMSGNLILSIKLLVHKHNFQIKWNKSNICHYQMLVEFSPIYRLDNVLVQRIWRQEYSTR